MSKVLMIDDDVKLAKLLKDYLSGLGFELETAVHADDGVRMVRSQLYESVILDVMLPGRNGFEVCQEIRRFSQVPILMLTARGDLADRVVGLELGADDYLPKPFEPRELVARIQSLIRRSGRNRTTGPTEINFDGFRIDRQRRAVFRDSKDIGLTMTEFELLNLLVSEAPRVVSRDEILDGLKGMDWESFDRSVDIAVSRLRSKLGDSAKSSKFIKTVRGEGYIFVGCADTSGERK